MRQTKLNLSNSLPVYLDKEISFLYSDEELIKRFQKGDETAYVELVKRYKDKLTNFVYHYIGDIDTTEDIVQDTMLKLYDKKDYYKEVAKFSTWIYTIARNLANTELRKKKRRKVTFLSHLTKDGSNYDIESSDLSIEKHIENQFLIDLLQKAIQKLPNHFRTVILLRDVQGLSYQDVSEIIEAPIGTIKSRINRARIQLQAELKSLK